MRRGPRIAVTEDAVVVTAIGGKQGRGRDGDLQAWSSADHGETWTGPMIVNDAHDSAREGLHGMAAGSDGSIWCVWLDLREKRTEVYASKSQDGGATWKSDIRVYRSPDGNVCECCHPSVAVTETSVHVMFRNSLAGNRDLYLASSLDHGKTFSPAKKLGEGAWKLDACPMDGGMLAIAPDGSLTTIWRRGKEIFTVNDRAEKEHSLGPGEQPWIAMASSGPIYVWTAGREGDLMIQKSGDKHPLKLAKSARDAMVVSAPNGAEPIIACWESKQDGQSSVMLTRIVLGR